MTGSHSPEPEYLLTVGEVAERCRLAQKAIRGAIKRNELRPAKVCSQWRVLPADLSAWLSANVAAPQPGGAPRVPHPNPGTSGFGTREQLDAIECEAHQ